MHMLLPAQRVYAKDVLEDSDMRARVPGLFTLLRCGCCELCAFRFLGQRCFALYREPPHVLRHIMESLWATLPEDLRGLDDWRACSDATAAAGTCTACLGALQNAQSEAFMKPFLEALSPESSGRDFSDYSLTITLPVATLIRQYALHYHLRMRHPGTEEFEEIDEVVEIKEAMKWILGYKLRSLLGINFSRESLFHVGVKLRHPETEAEHQFLYQIPELHIRPPRKRKNKNSKNAMGGHQADEEGSLTAATKALSHVSLTTFIKYGTVPPPPVTEAAKCELTLYHDSIYIAGRYAKYSRELSQSPWVVDNMRVSETSVQELITGPLNQHFLTQDFRFSSSGREDIDVRMLGEGRPFVLEIVNPRRTQFSAMEYLAMQNAINASTSLIRIRDLQRIRKEDSTLIQEGEEDKRKTYRCVVWLSSAITPDDLLPLLAIKDMVIDQTTPVRVLHRRTLCVRKRTVYGMQAQFISPHFITLDLTTQAGTYIKEFVHGDLGRTRPNLGEILGCEADILQLDVLAIELDFPKRLEDQAPAGVGAGTTEKEGPSDAT